MKGGGTSRIGRQRPLLAEGGGIVWNVRHLRVLLMLLLTAACAAQFVPPQVVQAPSVSTVRARCERLAGYAAIATGVEGEIVAQALDDCRAEVARFTPRRVSKWEKMAGYLAPALAAGQETYAVKRNLDWLEQRKRQKNAGQVEFNLSSEIVVDAYLLEGMGARWWRQRKQHRRGRAAGLEDAVTGAVLMPR